MSNVRVIKRYANRKLYDTERSCYVTLEDLATLIREGEEIKIIDNKSAEDLTTVTLAQIIFETEKKLAFMPLSLLRGLIQDSSQAIKGLAKGGADVVQQKAQDVREQASKLGERLGSAADSVGGEVAKATGTAEQAGPQAIGELVLGAKNSFAQLQQSFEEKFKGSMSNVARVASLGRDIEDIRQRLSGVEERINGLPQETKGEVDGGPSLPQTEVDVGSAE